MNKNDEPICTKNIVLIPTSEDHIDVLYKKAYCNPDFLRLFRMTSSHVSKEDIKRTILKNKKIPFEKRKYQEYLICHKQYGYIGMIALAGVNFLHKRAELLVGIFEKVHRKSSYALESTLAIIDYSFNQLQLNRIDSFVYDYNSNAQKSTESLGFTYEGIRKEYVYSTEKKRFIDVFCYGLRVKKFKRNYRLAKLSKRLLGHDITLQSQHKLTYLDKFESITRDIIRPTVTMASVCAVLSTSKAYSMTDTELDKKNKNIAQICSYNSGEATNCEIIESNENYKVVNKLDAQLNLTIPTFQFNNGENVLFYEGNLVYFEFEENGEVKFGFKVNNYREIKSVQNFEPVFANSSLYTQFSKVEYTSPQGEKKYFWANMQLLESEKHGLYFELLEFGELDDVKNTVYIDGNTQNEFISTSSGNNYIPYKENGVLRALRRLNFDNTYDTFYYNSDGKISYVEMSNGDTITLSNCTIDTCDILIKEKKGNSFVLKQFDYSNNGNLSGLLLHEEFTPIQKSLAYVGVAAVALVIYMVKNGGISKILNGEATDIKSLYDWCSSNIAKSRTCHSPKGFENFNEDVSDTSKELDYVNSGKVGNTENTDSGKIVDNDSGGKT